jgi:hypothetical protein
MGCLRCGQVNFCRATLRLERGLTAYCRNCRTRWTTKESWYYSRQRQQNFLFPKMARPAVRSSQPPTQWLPWVLSSSVRRQGREADLSPPSCEEVKRIKLYLQSPKSFMAYKATSLPSPVSNFFATHHNYLPCKQLCPILFHQVAMLAAAHCGRLELSQRDPLASSHSTNFHIWIEAPSQNSCWSLLGFCVLTSD